MMNSSGAFQVGDDSDDFAPNPFRSAGTTTGGGSDFLSAPNQQQQQQGMMMQQQPQGQPGMMMMHQQQQQQQAMMYPPQQQQQQFQQPDPNTGMTGTVYVQQQQPPPQQQQNQQQYLSGNMDQSNNSRAPVENYGGTDQIPSTNTPFRFGLNTFTACCRMDSYHQYFDVDTVDIGTRLRAAMLQFWQPDQFRTAVVGDAPDDPAEGGVGLKGPDLYGPFWLAMTLVFLIAVTSNMADYYEHKQIERKYEQQQNTTYPGGDFNVAEFEYDLHHLVRAATVVMVFSLLAPSMFWLACTCLGMPAIGWAMWMCCYGYAQVPVALSVLVAWFPLEILRWIVLTAGVASSGLLILRNLSTPLLAQDAANHARAMPVILSILGGHACYLIVLKFLFYN